MKVHELIDKFTFFAVTDREESGSGSVLGIIIIFIVVLSEEGILVSDGMLVGSHGDI